MTQVETHGLAARASIELTRLALYDPEAPLQGGVVASRQESGGEHNQHRAYAGQHSQSGCGLTPVHARHQQVTDRDV